jgi:hypothetical protein
LVRKFGKIADFRKLTYELAQTLENKRKNARKRRFALNGDPNGIYSVNTSPTRSARGRLRRCLRLASAEPYDFKIPLEYAN